MTQKTPDPTTYEWPEQRVTARIIGLRKTRGLSQRDLAAMLRAYLGTFGDSTYRNLETAPFNDRAAPWQNRLITQQLTTAIATVLDVPLTDLATPEEYAELLDKPQRKSRSNSVPPETLPTKPAPVKVLHPSAVAMRVKAFMRMYGFTPRSLATAIRFRGHHITETDLRKALRTGRTITHELLDGITRVFTAHEKGKQFDKTRFLVCEPTDQPCPHCRDYLIDDNRSN